MATSKVAIAPMKAAQVLTPGAEQVRIKVAYARMLCGKAQFRVFLTM